MMNRIMTPLFFPSGIRGWMISTTNTAATTAAAAAAAVEM
jgi:hypothetical protein